MAQYIRRNLWDIQREHDAGQSPGVEELDRLALAFHNTQQLPINVRESFFTLGGYHGMPNRGGGITDGAYWGGYCHHGNVLFPFWHRALLLELEHCLRSVIGCENVCMPYWDESSDDSAQYGLPHCLTDPQFVFKSLKHPAITNPFRSYKIPVKLFDQVAPATLKHKNLANVCSKPAGYETERYPRSGLVGTENDLKTTQENNKNYTDVLQNTQILNDNVKNAVSTSFGGIRYLMLRALETSNYTAFSNESSSASYNYHQQPVPAPVNAPPLANPQVALEEAHDPGHACTGLVAYYLDKVPEPHLPSDMACPETAGFDPLFYFHHAYIDYAFWKWQQKHGHTHAVEIDYTLEGTTAQYMYGTVFGFSPNEPLTLQTPLLPFKKDNGLHYISEELINIHQVGYDYAPGSLEPAKVASYIRPQPTFRVQIEGVDRSAVPGTFVITVHANKDGKKVAVGAKVVFNRFNASACMNCLSHLETKGSFGIFGDIDPESVEVEVKSMRVSQKLYKNDVPEKEAVSGFERAIFRVFPVTRNAD